MASSGQLTAAELQPLLEGGQLAGSWTLDGTRSTVVLKTRHTWGLRPLAGEWGSVSGQGTISPTGEVSGVITIAAESIDTKNSKRDDHLRSAAFFDAANHHDITFTVESVTPAGDGARVTGGLAIRETTRPVSFDARVTVTDNQITLDGEFPVNRGDFGLTWNFIGIAKMDNTIVVHAVFTRQ